MPGKYTNEKIYLPRRLRKILLIIILHSLVPLFILVLYQNLGKREVLIRQTKEDFLTLAKISSSRLTEKINDVNQTLVLLDGLGVFDKSKSEYCNSTVQNVISRSKTFTIIGAADINGNVFCASARGDKPTNIADRLYFKEAKEKMAFSSGEYTIGKITGILSLSFGLPLLDKSSQLFNVGFISISLDYLEELLSGITLPDEFNITIIDKNGTILARYPYNQEFIGKVDLADQAIAKILSGENEGSFVLKNNPSGKEKIYAYTRIDTTIGEGKVFTYIDVPTDFIRAESNKRLFSDILVSVLTVGLTVAILITDWYFFIHKKGRKTVG